MTAEQASAAYESLGRWVMAKFSDEIRGGGDIDGPELQDRAFELGIFVYSVTDGDDGWKQYVFADGAQNKGGDHERKA